MNANMKHSLTLTRKYNCKVALGHIQETLGSDSATPSGRRAGVAAGVALVASGGLVAGVYINIIE